jgi:hypothetical protein
MNIIPHNSKEEEEKGTTITKRNIVAHFSPNPDGFSSYSQELWRAQRGA